MKKTAISNFPTFIIFYCDSTFSFHLLGFHWISKLNSFDVPLICLINFLFKTFNEGKIKNSTFTATSGKMKSVLCYLKESIMIASSAAVFHICIGL